MLAVSRPAPGGQITECPAEVLLRFLAAEAGETGECRPTQRAISSATGLSIPEVRRAARTLVSGGRLLVDRPGADVAPSPNRYRVVS